MNVAGTPRIRSGTALRPSFTDGKSSVRSNNRDVDDVAATAALDLSFYAEPPNYELSLDEFEEFALARLKVLRTIEELRTRNVTGIEFRKQLQKAIEENLKPSLTSSSSSSSSSTTSKHKPKQMAQQAKKKQDIASHFILRAAYCKTEDLRRWFMTQETTLFKYQLEKLAESSSSSSLHHFLLQNDLHFEAITEEEKNKIKPFLLLIPMAGNGSGSQSSTTYNTYNDYKVPSLNEVSTTTYFKIHFSEASDLIAKRQCYVSKGYAYVPMPKLVSIITAKFRIHLSKSLAKASRVFNQVNEEYPPIAPLLQNMNSQYTGKDYNGQDQNGIGGNGTYDLTANNIESFVPSMPLCMMQSHNGLKQDSKLRHHGRLQYGLFLKGAGMNMEESLIFFQQQFTKIMSGEKFQKEYSYNIRHMYGKEGKRTSYSAYNCQKIIMGTPPNTGDHHGCPYKHYDRDHLASVLSKLKIGSAIDRAEILNLKQGRHFNLACQKHFDVMHPNAKSVKAIDLTGVGDHPNAWYRASVAYNAVKNNHGYDGDGKKSSSEEQQQEQGKTEEMKTDA